MSSLNIEQKFYSYSLVYKPLSYRALCPLFPKTKQVKGRVKSTCCVLGGDQGRKKESGGLFFHQEKHTGRSVTAPPVMLRLAGRVRDGRAGKLLPERARSRCTPSPAPGARPPSRTRGQQHIGVKVKKNKAVQCYFIPGSAAAEFQPHRSWLLTPARLRAGLRHTPLCQCLVQKENVAGGKAETCVRPEIPRVLFHSERPHRG